MTDTVSETATESGSPGTDAPPEDFPRLADPFRRELFAHCYRMTGSVHDAEDLVQETYLRAWRAYHSFEGRSSLRTWLHRIATNVCLTALEDRGRRPLPTGLGQPPSKPDEPLVEQGEVPWLEPVPDSLVSDPAEVAEARASIRLAFVAALQHLPPRQRAVLILRDVLRWRAAEVAEALGTTTVAVNSTLQRAHAQLAKAGLHEDDVVDEVSPEQQDLLDRYVDAFWRKDIDQIVSLLKADAVWEMPPYVGWYVGASAIGDLIARSCPGGVNDMRLVPTTANGQPAFGMYMRRGSARGAHGSWSEGDAEDFVPFQLQVLELEGDRVRHVAAFFDLSLFPQFGLPLTLPGH